MSSASAICESWHRVQNFISLGVSPLGRPSTCKTLFGYTSLWRIPYESEKWASSWFLKVKNKERLSRLRPFFWGALFSRSPLLHTSIFTMIQISRISDVSFTIFVPTRNVEIVFHFVVLPFFGTVNHDNARLNLSLPFLNYQDHAGCPRYHYYDYWNLLDREVNEQERTKAERKTQNSRLRTGAIVRLFEYRTRGRKSIRGA